MSNSNKITRKIGRNKGRPRVWLEGEVLTNNGFANGDMWNVVIQENCLGIQKDPEGKRKIAGTVERPIVDIVGKVIEECFNCDEVKVLEVVSIAGGHIELIPFVDED